MFSTTLPITLARLDFEISSTQNMLPTWHQYIYLQVTSQFPFQSSHVFLKEIYLQIRLNMLSSDLHAESRLPF